MWTAALKWTSSATPGDESTHGRLFVQGEFSAVPTVFDLASVIDEVLVRLFTDRRQSANALRNKLPGFRRRTGAQ